jgi:protein-S-isoprenylcysteine O-methyltransferase Ste14
MTLDHILKSRLWPAAWQVFVRTYAALLLPLLAWGMGDLSGFFANQIRTAYAIIIMLQALVGACLVYIMPPQPKHVESIDLTHWQIDMYHVVFLLAAYGDRRSVWVWEENPPLRWLGLGIYLIGAMLSVWVSLTLISRLRNTSGHTYVDPALLFDGPYKYIRHPELLCLIIYSLGFALVFRSWAGLVLLAPLTAGFIHRINNAEKDFAEQYKKIWPLRRRTSKRLFPFLY